MKSIALLLREDLSQSLERVIPELPVDEEPKRVLHHRTHEIEIIVRRDRQAGIYDLDRS